MKLPEPYGYFFRDSLKKFALPGYGFSIGSTPPPDTDELAPLFTKTQLREALAQQANEVAQLQEQNTALDARLASHEAVMRQALYVISAWDRGCEHDDYWRDCEEAIKALEDALK